MRFLIDECLHLSLVTVANEAGFEAHHIVHLGLQGKQDHELMGVFARENTYLLRTTPLTLKSFTRKKKSILA